MSGTEDVEDPASHDALLTWVHTTTIQIPEDSAPRPVQFAHTTHPPVRTSQDAADIRGMDIATGAKALVFKSKGKFFIMVISAAFKLNLKAVRRAAKVSSLSFASPAELKALTGCLPGAVPPFGSRWNIPTYVDTTLSDHPIINFNLGLRTASLAMPYADYMALEKPIVVSVAKT